MGLLDYLRQETGLPFNPDLNDPKTQFLVSTGLSLLGGNPRTNKNFGADMAYAGSQGLGAYTNARQFQMQQQAMERQNRASDLQTAMGAYQFLRSQELPKMLTQGASYTPPPELGQLESRISQIINEGNLSGTVKSASQTPTTGAASPAPAPTLPPAVASQYSPVVKPQYQAQGPMPSAQTAPPQSPMGGPAGGLPMQYWLMIDPTGKSYAEQLAKDNALISTRYGIFQPRRDAQGNITSAAPVGGALPSNALPYSIGPNGQATVAPLPGQIETQGKVAEAGARGTEAGKFPGRIENVTLASGATVPQLLSSVVGNPYSGQPPSGARPQSAAPAAAPAPSAAAAAPANAQDPFADIPKRYVPQGLGQSSFDKEMASKQAESASTLSTKLGSQADAASSRIALNNQALKLVDQADTGPKAALLGDVKNWLVSRVGIPESEFQNTPSATIALQKDLLNAATQRAKQQFGSRITQSEVMLMLTRGSPNVDMTKASIKYLIDSDNAMQNYQIKQANDLGTYLQKGGDPMRFESWYASKFPATAALGTVHLKSEIAPTAPQSAPNIDALVNKYRTR